MNSVVPLFIDGGTLAVALADPDEVPMIDELKTMTKLEIQPFLSTRKQIAQASNGPIKPGTFPL